jgi:hypothetical protein
MGIEDVIVLCFLMVHCVVTHVHTGCTMCHPSVQFTVGSGKVCSLALVLSSRMEYIF